MTAWTALLMLPIVLLTWLGLALGQTAIVRAQAQSSADLAVLAASAAGGDGCAAAQHVLEANALGALSPGMRLAACEASAGDAYVRVDAVLPPLAERALGWLAAEPMTVSAQARATSPLAFRKMSRTRMAAALSSGSLPLPHFGD